MIVKNKTMMDAGCILFTRKQEGTGLGIGTELGQLLAHLKEFGKVERINDLDASATPRKLRDYDFLLNAGGLLCTSYLAVKLEDAGQGRYAISLYATPNRRTNKIIARLKELYTA